jgi:uncharacterized protein YjbI with pentapeptide repeats
MVSQARKSHQRPSYGHSFPVGANLIDADLRGAKGSFAYLTGTNLRGANLSNADLREAKNLTQTQLDQACGDADTKLPEGLTIKPCSTVNPSQVP